MSFSVVARRPEAAQAPYTRAVPARKQSGLLVENSARRPDDRRLLQ
jgi:hypothetical protein